MTSVVTMNNENPWASLVAPVTESAVSARRVDASIPWGFFWARDIHNNCLLILRHQASASPKEQLPHIKGLQLSLLEGDEHGTHVLSFQLLDTNLSDVFHRLCLDIVAATATAENESQAVRLALARTWRWHHLLRGGVDDRLSPEEQKGVIGELYILSEILLPSLLASEAVGSWRGPLGSPKDFEIGGIAIEAKARRGAATPYITISSEFQLDSSGTDHLYLHVTEVNKAQADAADSFTISEKAASIHQQLLLLDPVAADIFQSRLMATGFKWEDNYSDMKWVLGSKRLFRIEAGFPRITPASIESGVSRVQYSISLMDCTPFEVDLAGLISSLGGGCIEQ